MEKESGYEIGNKKGCKYRLVDRDRLLFLISHKSCRTIEGIKKDMMNKPEPPYNPEEEKKLDNLMADMVYRGLVKVVREKDDAPRYRLSKAGKKMLDQRFNELRKNDYSASQLESWLYFTGM